MSIHQSELEILTAHVLNITREHFFLHPETKITQKQSRKLQSLITRRKNGEPLAYLLGYKEFYGRNFLVTPDVLVPRPETETVIEEVKKLYHKIQPEKLLTIDIGTGSGCIAITLACELSKHMKSSTKYTKNIATDVSSKALKIAHKNAEVYKCQNIRFHKSNLLTFLLNTPDPLKNYSHIFITANLPYVPTKYLNTPPTLSTIGLRFEPQNALDGGTDGLVHYRALVKQILEIKQKNPFSQYIIFLEIDPSQTHVLQNLIPAPLTATKDLAGLDRVVIFSI